MLRCNRVGLALVGVLAGALPAVEREKTPAELVQIAKARTANPVDRMAAIAKLGEITDEKIVRDNKIGDELIAIGKFFDPVPAKQEDIFVRIDAIKATAKLQLNADKLLKDKYIGAYSAILRDIKEHNKIRKAVATVFKETWEPKGLKDGEAYKAILEIAKLKGEGLEGLRGACIEAIGTYGGGDGLDTLVTMLSDPEQGIKEKAAGALFDLLNRLTDVGPEVLPLPAVNKLVEMVGNQAMAAELRVNVMKVLGRLIRDGNKSAVQGMQPIIKIARNEDDTKLVIGAVEALGIIGSAEGVTALVEVYEAFMEKKPAAPPAGAGAGDPVAAAAAALPKGEFTDVRVAVMKAFASVLSSQAAKTAPDMKAVRLTAETLVKALDSDPSPSVVEASVFALRYLYPAKFKPEHDEVVHALIFRMTNAKTGGEELKAKIADTLEAITNRDYGTDAKRWDEWFQKVHGGAKPKAPAVKKAP